jgi:hypothetical protein
VTADDRTPIRMSSDLSTKAQIELYAVTQKMVAAKIATAGHSILFRTAVQLMIEPKPTAMPAMASGTGTNRLVRGIDNRDNQADNRQGNREHVEQCNQSRCKNDQDGEDRESRQRRQAAGGKGTHAGSLHLTIYISIPEIVDRDACAPHHEPSCHHNRNERKRRVAIAGENKCP